jgi:hypothetical protein
MDFPLFGTSFLALQNKGGKYFTRKAPTHRRGVPIPAHILFSATLSLFKSRGSPMRSERGAVWEVPLAWFPDRGLTAKNSFIDLFTTPQFSILYCNNVDVCYMLEAAPGSCNP